MKGFGLAAVAIVGVIAFALLRKKTEGGSDQAQLRARGAPSFAQGRLNFRSDSISKLRGNTFTITWAVENTGNANGVSRLLVKGTSGLNPALGFAARSSVDYTTGPDAESSMVVSWELSSTMTLGIYALEVEMQKKMGGSYTRITGHTFSLAVSAPSAASALAAIGSPVFARGRRRR